MSSNIVESTKLRGDHLTRQQKIKSIMTVCINKRFRGTLQDVRVKRGADVGSDHQLLVAQVKLKLRRDFSGNSSKRQRYNTALLRNATKLGEFQLALSNRFEALQDWHKDDTLDKQWEGVKETVRDTCKEILGPNKSNKREWISEETLQKVEERRRKKTVVNNSRTRAQKAKAQKDYNDAHRAV